MMAEKLGNTRGEAEGGSEKKHMREGSRTLRNSSGYEGEKDDTACLELVAAKGVGVGMGMGMGEVCIGLFGGDGVEVTKDGGFSRGV